MTDTAPAVALLFDDTELGGQLREALHERGARIVHEGAVSSLSRELLLQVGADVLVVNLDDSADDALDHLYDMIDGDRPKVVFNDAQASRALAGWDRARWARHLAVKVLSAGDVDPPRPGDARIVETAPVAPAPPTEPAPEVEATIAVAAGTFVVDELPAQAAPDAALSGANEATQDGEPDFLVHDDPDGRHEQVATAESESLAAELEALLASGELPSDDEDDTGPGLRHFDDDDLPPLHDGNFGEAATEQPAMDAVEPTMGDIDDAGPGEAALPGDLQLSPLADDLVADIPAATIVAPAAPDSWTLLDDDAPVLTEPVDAAAFGIEKLSAADFLAPDVEAVVPEFEPMMSLELVTMEEAIAPQAFVQDHEMLLDVPGSALSRVVLLGAAAGGIDSVCAFLGALPASTRLTFVHAQHLDGQPVAALIEKLGAHCALPVRQASHQGSVGTGEVLVVPPGQQVRLRRDGHVELQADADPAQEPSIDATLTMAANAFGRDALAIVFSGRGNDAVAGAQAIHDRGGEVWVESSPGERFADMVGGIFAERLVSFSGTPPELAARLIEVFP